MAPGVAGVTCNAFLFLCASACAYATGKPAVANAGSWVTLQVPRQQEEDSHPDSTQFWHPDLDVDLDLRDMHWIWI